jgi:hypothetical protein
MPPGATPTKKTPTWQLSSLQSGRCVAFLGKAALVDHPDDAHGISVEPRFIEARPTETAEAVGGPHAAGRSSTSRSWSTHDPVWIIQIKLGSGPLTGVFLEESVFAAIWTVS